MVSRQEKNKVKTKDSKKNLMEFWQKELRHALYMLGRYNVRNGTMYVNGDRNPIGKENIKEGNRERRQDCIEVCSLEINHWIQKKDRAVAEIKKIKAEENEQQNSTENSAGNDFANDSVNKENN